VLLSRQLMALYNAHVQHLLNTFVVFLSGGISLECRAGAAAAVRH
jgi:hypothetical protein